MRQLGPDETLLLELCARHGVQALIIGGHAVAFHGYPRYTGDLDIFYGMTEANTERLYEALQAFWGPRVPLVAGPGDLRVRGDVLQYGHVPHRVDFLNRMGTVPFDEAWRERCDGPLPLPVLSLRHLLQAKRDAGRPKDLIDIDRLTRTNHAEE